MHGLQRHGRGVTQHQNLFTNESYHFREKQVSLIEYDCHVVIEILI